MGDKINFKRFHNFEARYHRNGICGVGFYACKFLYVDERGHAIDEIMAAYFPKEGRTAEYYAVMSDDVGCRWRGDHFVDDLRDAIETYGAFAHA